jgi:hypothetical protein
MAIKAKVRKLFGLWLAEIPGLTGHPYFTWQEAFSAALYAMKHYPFPKDVHN